MTRPYAADHVPGSYYTLALFAYLLFFY